MFCCKPKLEDVILPYGVDICTGHYHDYESQIADFVAQCDSRKIKSIDLIQNEYCLLSYPCKGHRGVKVIFANSDALEFQCGSVTAGIIFCFCGVSKHCVEYVNAPMKKKIEQLRRSKYPKFKTI